MNRSPSTCGPQRTTTQVNTTQVNTTQMLLREVEAIAARSLSEVSRGETVPHEKKGERNPLFERVQRDPKELRCVNVQFAPVVVLIPPRLPSPPVGSGHQVIKGSTCDKEKGACGLATTKSYQTIYQFHNTPWPL